ncbi:gamma-tubulin ring complex protein [Peniophora sp. CONT]|nr:gamma-tubulin ring complex protein [Peniophora sp. CONT]
MIAEVLLVLAGHESSLFPDGSTLHPAFDSLLHPGEKQCLESLGLLASRYRSIRSTTLGLARSRSQYLCALCATLTQILRDEYEALVVSTEAQILHRDPSLVASGSYVPLSALRAAFAHWDAPLAALEVLLADICGRPESEWPPGLLIDTLLSRASTGTHSISDIIGRLACAVQRVWQTELIALLVHGSLSSIDPLAETDYSLREGYVPSCVSVNSRAAISYVGRALGTVKAAQAQTRFPRELVARHTEILQDILVQDTYKFDRAVGEIRTNVSEWLWLNVLTQKNVDEAVDSLSNYFLLRNGEFSTALIRELERLKFTRLTTRSNLIREQDLHLALLRASLGTSAQHDPSLLRLRFTLPTGPLRPLIPTLPRAADITASAEMAVTPAFDDLLLGTPLLLSYTVSWPLDLFLTPTDLALYAALFGYLSALRRTHARVHTAWASLSNAQRARRKWTGLGEGGTREDLDSRERLLRCGWGVVRCMGWFLDCLLGYTMSDVVDTEYAKLKTAVAGAPSSKAQNSNAQRRARASSIASIAQKSTTSQLDSADPVEALDFTTLRALHSAYLERLLAGSLVGNGALATVIRPIFELCDTFVAHVERWGGDVLPALLAEGSVSGGGEGVGKMVQERWEVVSEINEVRYDQPVLLADSLICYVNQALNTLMDAFYEQLTQSTAQPIRPDISRSVFNATAANMTSAFKTGNTTTMRRDARLRENEGETRRQIERLLLRLDFNEEFTRARKREGREQGILKQGGLA